MKFILTILFLLALVRSFYHLPHSSFDADEEYFAMSGKSILSGKLTLIGQQTGVGELYHAPLFNYLIAGLMFISGGNPLVIKGLGAILAAVTVPAVFILGQKITSPLAAFFSALLVLFGDSFLGLESFAPNITPLTLIILICLWVKTTSWKKGTQSFILGSLVGLSAHFHILGLMLVPLLIFTGWEWLPALLFFLSPLIAFDLRHNHLIFSHAVNFFSNSGSFSTPIYYRIHTYLISLADLINFSQTGKIFVPIVILTILWGFLIPALKREVKIGLVLPLIYFVLYTKHLVPYYSIVAWTPFILTVGLVLTEIWKRNSLGKLLVITFLAIFSYQNTLNWLNWRAVRGIDKKISALEFIKSDSDGKKINISRTIELPANFGFDYLMEYIGISSTGNPADPTYTLVMPINWQGIHSDKIFGDVGIILPKKQ